MEGKQRKKPRKSRIKFQLDQNPETVPIKITQSKTLRLPLRAYSLSAIPVLQSSVTFGELISLKHIERCHINRSFKSHHLVCTLTLWTTAIRRPEKWKTGNVILEKGVHKQRCTMLLCATRPVCALIVKDIVTAN